MGQRQIIVHRVRPKETRIQNSIIWEGSVSIAARFTHIAMLSLPDDWDYSVRGMAVMLGISKDTISRYLRELEKAEYLKRVQPHSEKGNFCKAEYILTDTPGNFGDEGPEEPCPKKPDTEAPPCPNFPAPVLSAPEKSPQKKRTEEKNVNIPPIPPTGGGAEGAKRTSPSRPGTRNASRRPVRPGPRRRKAGGTDGTEGFPPLPGGGTGRRRLPARHRFPG